MEDVTRWIGSASAAISSASVWLDAQPKALSTLILVGGGAALALVFWMVVRVLAWATWPFTRAGREFRR